MARVQIDAQVWDLIVAHYAAIKDPSPDDQAVIRYIYDKESRRLAREMYTIERRLSAYEVNED